jgi:tetratricopeptide (TPR) repeat protein
MIGVVRLRRGAVLVGALLLLLLRGPALISRAWGTVGLMALVSSLTSTPDELHLKTLAQAKRLLHQALTWDEENHGAHRGLAWVLAVRGEAEEASSEWRAGGFTVLDFIARGERSRQAGQYEDAMTWYRRATWLDSELGDPYYYMGRACEGMEEWKKALRAYERAIELNSFLEETEAGVSSAYCRIGIIYQQEQEPRALGKALVAFQEAITTDSFGSFYRQRANCHYRLGLALQQSGRGPDEYVPEFEQAVQLDPRHSWAHYRLGVAYYVGYKDVRMAERELLSAIEISPDSKWAYWSLGNVYRNEQEYGKAIGMYETVLELDPECSPVREQLEKIRSSLEID